MTTGWERIAGWVSYVVGDGRRVRFWYDILCVLFENCSLKKLNRNLFSIAMEKVPSVYSCSGSSNEGLLTHGIRFL